MLTALEKRDSNIAEYLLYMWQVEDIIRACNLDVEIIDRVVVAKYQADEQTKIQIHDWYSQLIDMMRDEDKVKSGHLQINNNVIINLSELHSQLLKSPKFPEYGAEFYKTLPFIVELRAKAGESVADELVTCFNALYMVLMMRMNKREISAETSLAIKQISKFIATLASFYKKDKEESIFDK